VTVPVGVNGKNAFAYRIAFVLFRIPSSFGLFEVIFGGLTRYPKLRVNFAILPAILYILVPIVLV